MMRVYIAGPMSNVVNWNRESFEKTALDIRAEYPDCEIVSPIELHDQDGGLPSEEERLKDGDKHRRTALLRNIAALMTCTHLVRIDSMIDSLGACAEWMAARAVGIKCEDIYYFLHDDHSLCCNK